MKELTLREFSDYCKQVSVREFVYSTENQKEGEFANVKVDLKFPSMISMLAPDRLCFKGADGVLWFNAVDKIVLGEQTDGKCGEFDVMSGGEDYKFLFKY